MNLQDTPQNRVHSDQRASEWERNLTRRLLASDVVIVLLAVFASQWLRWGSLAAELRISLNELGTFSLQYTELSLLIAALWIASLSLDGSRAPQVLGVGPTEYKRVFTSTFFAFGGFAIVAFLAKAPIGRGYLLYALPIGLVLLLLARWAWRKQLHRNRKRGREVYRTLILGERSKSEHVARQIMRSHENGLWIVGAITEHGSKLDLVRDIEVVGDYDSIIESIDRTAADTLVLTSADALSPERIRALGWELENRNVDLIVAASLTDIAGPRIHTQPVAGLPLIHVEYPRFTGSRRFVKRTFDLIASACALCLLSPVFLLVAVAIKLDSRGPVFFRQDRMGINGTPFKILKFRSMTVDAEERLHELRAHSDGNGLLFKMKNDPRVTRVGQLIRKLSVDELPQLVNVIKGDMSLVGPRPLPLDEVSEVNAWTRRRQLVLPGITGLWQVSGRSDLSQEDSVRLDLYYVENWSIVGDLILLFRTVRTIAKREGAY